RDTKLEDFERLDAGRHFEEATFVRQAHGLILFGLIPAYVAQLLGRMEHSNVLASPLGDLVPEISEMGVSDLVSAPGRLFGNCLTLIERHRGTFKACLDPG
ncbi:hypothetical protein, partial [Allomesorhizobium camelthorni]|uniref:hypothetical protein n=1 Tax=Allomesorhizobium camelthorni TaxID=475069 RepID=UPI00197E231D